MEISRYASRLASTSSTQSSGSEFEPSSSAENPKVTRNVPDFSTRKFALDLPQEPEDASLTGGTRSLSRRLLALNIPGLSAVQPSINKSGLKRVPGKSKNPKRILMGSDFQTQA